MWSVVDSAVLGDRGVEADFESLVKPCCFSFDLCFKLAFQDVNSLCTAPATTVDLHPRELQARMTSFFYKLSLSRCTTTTTENKQSAILLSNRLLDKVALLLARFKGNSYCSKIWKTTTLGKNRKIKVSSFGIS